MSVLCRIGTGGDKVVGRKVLVSCYAGFQIEVAKRIATAAPRIVIYWEFQTHCDASAKETGFITEEVAQRRGSSEKTLR